MPAPRTATTSDTHLLLGPMLHNAIDPSFIFIFYEGVLWRPSAWRGGRPFHMR